MKPDLPGTNPCQIRTGLTMIFNIMISGALTYAGCIDPFTSDTRHLKPKTCYFDFLVLRRKST